MYKIYLYENARGQCQIENYLSELREKSSNDKSSRIKLNKLVAYINRLAVYGPAIGQPYVKHLNAHLWELRPINMRILFSIIGDDTIVLLSIFAKQSQKTPKRELLLAEKRLQEYLERNKNENLE